MPEIILIGAGTIAKAIITAARLTGKQVRAVYDDDPARAGESILGVPVAGPISEAAKAGLPAVIGLDDPQQRKAVAKRLKIAWTTVVHPQAFLYPSSTIGPGSVILEGVVVQPSVAVGRHALIGANATVAHDSVLEDFVRLGPGVDLAGNVHVAEGASLDAGAVVIPNKRVGAWASVGPRAAVIHDVPDNDKVGGVPAAPEDAGNSPPDRGPFSGGETALAFWLIVGSMLHGLGCAIRGAESALLKQAE